MFDRPSSAPFRKVKPKPFSRPSIDLTGSVKRSWQLIHPKDIREGDILPDKGVVVSVRSQVLSDNVIVTIVSGEDLITVYETNDPVMVFAAGDGE